MQVYSLEVELRGKTVYFEPRDIEFRLAAACFTLGSAPDRIRFVPCAQGVTPETGSLPYVIREDPPELLIGAQTSAYVREIIRNKANGWHAERWATEGLAVALGLVVDYLKWHDDVIYEEWTLPVLRSRLNVFERYQFVKHSKKEFQRRWRCSFGGSPTETVALTALRDVLRHLRAVLATDYIGGNRGPNVEDAVFFSHLAVLCSMPCADHRELHAVLLPFKACLQRYCETVATFTRNAARMQFLAAYKSIWPFATEFGAFQRSTPLPRFPQAARNRRARLYESQRARAAFWEALPMPASGIFVSLARLLLRPLLKAVDPVAAFLDPQRVRLMRCEHERELEKAASWLIFVPTIAAVAVIAALQRRRLTSELT